MDWATLYPLLMITAILVLLWVAYLSWQRRESAGALTFTVLMLTVAGWTFFYAMELSSGNLALTQTWYKLRYVFTAFIPMIWLVFTLQYSGQQQWLTPKPITLLSAVHLALVIGILTNDWHELLWVNPQLGSGNTLTPFTADFSRGHGLLGVLIPMEMLLGVALMLIPAQGSYRTYRFQTLSIIVAVMLSFLAQPVLEALFGESTNDFELILPLVLTSISSVVLAVGFFRLGVLDVVPIGYNAVMDNIPDGVLVVDTHHRIVAVNPAFRTTFSPIVKPIGQVLDEVLPNIPTELCDPRSDLNHCEMLHKGRWYEIRVAPVKNWRKQNTGQVLIARDITEQRNASQSQVRYEALFNQAQDAIMISTTDAQIVDANPAAERLFGYNHDELVTMHTTDLQPDEYDSNGNRSITGRFELPVKNSNGEHREVEVTRASIGDGENRLYMSILRDITERKRSESEMQQRIIQLNVMRQLSDEVSTTLDISQVMIMALDAAQRLSGAGAGFIALKDSESGVMRIVTMIGSYAKNTVLLDGKGIAGRVMHTLEPEFVRDVTDDPDYVAYLPTTCAQMVIPLISQDTLIGLINLETDKPDRFDEDGFQFMQILAGRVSVDIDNARLYQHEQGQRLELQQLYHQVRRLEQLKTDMIRIAAHDLKNPLLAITGHLELYELDRDQLSEEHQDYLETMITSGRRMNRMIDDILSLERIEQMAKIDAGEYTVFDIVPHVQQGVNEYSKQAGAKSQTFTLHLDTPKKVEVRGDHAQLYEAITNLISNAIKYTPTNGQVDVYLTVQDNGIMFKVEDTGYGIPEDSQSRLFQPFYRAMTSETRTIEGTGLGLHLVKNIIERHAGEMLFESVYGEGSTFGFMLPVVD